MPWRTVAKVATAPLAPGDQVHFKRGTQWRESLSPKVSGAAGRPITFDAYGSGPKPVFYGSDVLDNAGFTDQGGGVYRYVVGPGIDPGYAYPLCDHAFIGKGPATYHDGVIDVALESDPRSNGKLYTFCRRGNTVTSGSMSHLVFRDLVADETAANPDGAQQGYGMRADTSSDVLFERCEALRCGRHNFGCINSDQVIFRGCHAAYVAPMVPGENSLYVSYADTNCVAPTSTSSYEGCTGEHQQKTDGGTYNFFDGHSQDGHPLHVTFTKVVSNDGKFYCDSFAGGTYSFHGCTIGGGRIEGWTDHLVVENTVFSGSAFIDSWKNALVVENCVWDQVTPGETACILLRDGSRDGTIRFNTIRSPGTCIGFYGRAKGLRLQGNIFSGTPTSGGKADDVATADCNLYLTIPASLMGQPWVTWLAAGRDVHARFGDPLFVAPDKGDYHLRPGSPAHGGATLTAEETPATDADGTVRPHGQANDMGAFSMRVAK